jgi:hypothetical protein
MAMDQELKEQLQEAVVALEGLHQRNVGGPWEPESRLWKTTIERCLKALEGRILQQAAEHQVLKTAILRLKDEVLKEHPVSLDLAPHSSFKPTVVKFPDRFRQRLSLAGEEELLTLVEELDDPPGLGCPVAGEVQVEVEAMFKGLSVEGAEAIGGLHVEEARGHVPPVDDGS